MNQNDLNDNEDQISASDKQRNEDVRLHELGYDRKRDQLTEDDVIEILQDEDEDVDNVRLSNEVPADERDDL